VHPFPSLLPPQPLFPRFPSSPLMPSQIPAPAPCLPPHRAPAFRSVAPRVASPDPRPPMAAAAGSATGEATARVLLQRHQPFAPPSGSPLLARSPSPFLDRSPSLPAAALQSLPPPPPPPHAALHPADSRLRPRLTGSGTYDDSPSLFSSVHLIRCQHVYVQDSSPYIRMVFLFRCWCSRLPFRLLKNNKQRSLMHAATLSV
jgi:hypothetical protein